MWLGIVLFINSLIIAAFSKDLRKCGRIGSIVYFTVFTLAAWFMTAGIESWPYGPVTGLQVTAVLVWIPVAIVGFIRAMFSRNRNPK